MKYLRALSALALAAGLAIAAISGAGGALNASAALDGAELERALADGDMIRLHIVADDDSAEAQRVKLCVRDALLERFGGELSAQGSQEAALEWLSAHIGDIERAADAQLRAQGAQYSAHVRLGEAEFPDREYGGVTVPAGRYMALRVELGEARGRNWWCVIYPTVCALSPDLPASGEVRMRSAVWDWLRGVFGL